MMQLLGDEATWSTFGFRYVFGEFLMILVNNFDYFFGKICFGMLIC